MNDKIQKMKDKVQQMKKDIKGSIHKYLSIKEFLNIDYLRIKKASYKILIGVTVASTTFIFLGTRNNAYAIAVNGEVVAVVRDKEEAKVALEQVVVSIKAEKGVDIAVNEVVSIEPVNKKTKEIDSSEVAAEALNKVVSYQVSACEIVVDGEAKAIVKNMDIASQILSEIAKQQLPEKSEISLKTTVVKSEEREKKIAPSDKPIQPQGELDKSTKEELQVQDALPTATVTSQVNIDAIKVQEVDEIAEKESGVKRQIKEFDFNEKIMIRSVYVDLEQVMSEKEVIDILLSKTERTVEYELKEGDNIWDIAISHDTTMEHILEINPQIEDDTRMQIGDKIKLEVPDPMVSMVIAEEATFKEVIPMEIEYIEVDTLYKDETKVKEEGSDGLKEVTVLLRKVNGKEISRETVTETVLEESVKKVMEYGTKKKPTNGAGESVRPTSGLFMNPLNGRGRVSSGYGYRGSAFHKGIDLAASAGTPIYAAASGKVIYSGYNSGGYGKMIILDHGNGYKTYYAHCSKVYAQVGQWINKGENIAGVGNTGNSDGNHLHFEIRSGGSPINPYGYIY